MGATPCACPTKLDRAIRTAMSFSIGHFEWRCGALGARRFGRTPLWAHAAPEQPLGHTIRQARPPSFLKAFPAASGIYAIRLSRRNYSQTLSAFEPVTWENFFLENQVFKITPIFSALFAVTAS
jgi:hypothetical protein